LAEETENPRIRPSVTARTMADGKPAELRKLYDVWAREEGMVGADAGAARTGSGRREVVRR
jgi:hypothetical protein